MTNKTDKNSNAIRAVAQSQSEQTSTDTNPKYHVLSPDGLPVTDKPFASRKEAAEYIPVFCQRFAHQGYYAAVSARIALDELPKYLRIVSEDSLLESEPKSLSDHPKATFATGEIVMTRNAAEQIPNFVILLALARHYSGDWGDVCQEDWQANDEALEVENRLHSVYCSPDGVKFWIITEWDRSVTTILLPDDY